MNRATRFDQEMMTTTPALWRRWVRHIQRQVLPYYFTTPPGWRVFLRHLIDKDRVAPDFASLGAVRSGTTQLADYIMQHPCVVLPLAKEIGMRSTPVAKLIMAQFPTRRRMLRAQRKYGKAITGYCSPVMPSLSFPDFARAISPNAKFIILMRDPVERAFAHWRWDEALLHNVRGDILWKYRSFFGRIVQLEVQALQNGGHADFSISGLGSGYIRSGIYLPFLKRLREFYPASAITYINSEAFFAEPVQVAKQVYKFLDLPPYEPVAPAMINRAPPATMSPTTRKFLSQFFARYNQELYEFVGRDFGWQ